MYICLCKAITDNDIRDAVHSGAASLADVQHQLGVSTGCGTCMEAAEEVISETLSRAAERLTYAA
jgi:bacterioferritin-associated ferredoxin